MFSNWRCAASVEPPGNFGKNSFASEIFQPTKTLTRSIVLSAVSVSLGMSAKVCTRESKRLMLWIGHGHLV